MLKSDMPVVMIVEFSDCTCARFAEPLAEKGFLAVPAPYEGLKLVELIRMERPMMVLMEYEMPSLNAVEVMDKIQSLHLPDYEPHFLVVGSSVYRERVQEVMAAGAQFFLTRPLSVEYVVQCIGHYANERPLLSEKLSKAVKEPMDLEQMVTDIIKQIGVPAHIKGYHYVRESIMLAVQSPEIINSVTKVLYPEVARRFDTTTSRVERAIRHAIEVAWDRGDVDTLTNYFGYTIHNQRGKPTNSEFVAMIADRLRLKIKHLKQYSQKSVDMSSTLHQDVQKKVLNEPALMGTSHANNETHLHLV